MLSLLRYPEATKDSRFFPGSKSCSRLRHVLLIADTSQAQVLIILLELLYYQFNALSCRRSVPQLFLYRVPHRGLLPSSGTNPRFRRATSRSRCHRVPARSTVRTGRIRCRRYRTPMEFSCPCFIKIRVAEESHRSLQMQLLPSSMKAEKQTGCLPAYRSIEKITKAVDPFGRRAAAPFPQKAIWLSSRLRGRLPCTAAWLPPQSLQPAPAGRNQLRNSQALS